MQINLQHDCIGVFDSGIGGLSVANAVSGLLPRENLLYIADNARAPYGARRPAEVQKFARQLTQTLIEAGAKLILVACNTATAQAIDLLRSEWPEMPFVGIEPAVKPAAAATRSGVIGVMATQITLGSERYQNLAGRYTRELRVLEDPCIGLVPTIESGIDDQHLRDLLAGILDPMLTAGADTIVLGCTHYPFVSEQIKAICGPEVELVNPAEPTARQVVRLLAGKNKNSQEDELLVRYDFFSSGSALPVQRALLQLEPLNKQRALVAGHIEQAV